MSFLNLSKLSTDVPEKLKKDVVIPQELHGQWKETWGQSYQVENFFSENDLEWLTDFMFKEHSSRRVKECGTVHFFCENRKIQDRFYDRLKSVIPELENDVDWEGNFLLTSSPYNLHIDSGRPKLLEKGIIPSKQIIIPLFVCHVNKEFKDTDSIPDAGTGIFKNRFIKFGSNFAKSDENYSTDVFFTVRQYSELTCYMEDGSIWDVDWNKPFDIEIYEKYFSHFPRQWLDGFELENVFNWNRGSLIVFDRSQAHSGINFQNNRVTMKAGLSFMTNKRVKC